MSKYIITFAGDTSLGDGYLSTDKRVNEKKRLQSDPFSFFEDVAPFIKKSDFFILNLETVLAVDPPSYLKDKKFPNWDDPSRTPKVLNQLGVDAVTLANNHTRDFGPKILLDTINVLDKAKIKHIGAGADSGEASKHLKIEIKGSFPKKTIYVFNGMRATRRYRDYYEFLAKKDTPGVNSLNENRMTRRITAVKEKDPNSIVIVCAHWAEADYKWIGESAQIRARKFVDAGADFVIAHGTHMANHIEKYESGIIAYSLGNFVFNAPGRYAKMGAPPYSMIANLTIEEENSEWNIKPAFYPIMTDNKQNGFHCRFTTYEETVELLGHLNERQYLGTPKEIIRKDNERYYFDIEYAGENIKLVPDELEQLLPKTSLTSKTDFEDLEDFSEEVEQLKEIQDKIDDYLVQYYRKFYNNSSVTTDKEKLSMLSKVVDKRYLSHGFLKKFERKKIPMTNSLSFRDIMVEKSAMRKLGYKEYSWQLDRKTKAYEFADTIGLRRPESDSQIYRFEEIKGKAGPIVIKPVQSTGSMGVYLIFNENRILSARGGHYLNSWGEIEAEMRPELEAVYQGNPRGALRKDEWIVEELILRAPDSTEPPLDYKFYCFYGEVVFVLEADRSDSSGFSTWDRDGNLIQTGWQDNKLREGVGFSHQDAEVAIQASLQVPSPFVRMDMLKSHDGIVFGEATPRPGRFHLFNKEFDRTLGKAYREAEARLLQDLLRGKKFDAFTKHFDV
ncbi:CapA family protein [Alkalicoccus daliensis]|uniref:TupA-like ATPgrasp n=1 Tax=Alkalicoccus daliensis TaxID=745820 RepID=A0A1H0GI70_9BACI|nr:CapA family protein [Alkalicoccus daliensis]SDO06606.1 TupA-like ATPgrasp [Alkalicoccus daliensis]